MKCRYQRKPSYYCFKENKICSYADGTCRSFERVEEQPKTYCKYCFNARIYEPTEEDMMNPFNTELTDENDSSSCGVGHACSDHRWMISSGYGEPVRIEMDCWNKSRHEWVTVGKYYPKYCPECGRKLDEYSKDNNYN